LQYDKEKHFEPVGEEYLKHAWEKIDRELRTETTIGLHTFSGAGPHFFLNDVQNSNRH
jgi:hypothetical protein